MNSKRRLLSLFISLACINASGQKNSLANLVNVISQESCKCLSESGTQNFDSLSTYMLSKCLFKSMMAHKTLVLEVAKNVYGDTSDATGDKLGHQLFKSVSSELVYDCDLFYDALSEDRKADYKSYFGLSKDSVRATLEKKYEVPTRLRDGKYYHLRGCDYFNLQDFLKRSMILTVLKFWMKVFSTLIFIIKRRSTRY